MTMDAESRTVFDSHFSHVEVKVETLQEGGAHLSVAPIWKGVDRPDVGGWGLPLADRRLADRLARAVEAGAAFGCVRRCTDVGGKSYISAGHAVLGRKLNADLRRLGY